MRISEMCKEEFLAVWEIMKESFPLDERRPFEEQKALLSKPCYRIFVLCEEDSVQGFIALWELCDLVFIEHFAVAKEHRCKGFGAKLLDFVTKRYSCDICLEVEVPDSEITKRRVEFYKRNGFHLNTYPYTQPPLSKGQNPVSLMVMTYGKAVTNPGFEAIKDKLYREVYNNIDL